MRREENFLNPLSPDFYFQSATKTSGTIVISVVDYLRIHLSFLARAWFVVVIATRSDDFEWENEGKIFPKIFSENNKEIPIRILSAQYLTHITRFYVHKHMVVIA